MTDPTFVLAGRDGALVADGVEVAYPRLDDARAALAARQCPIIVGALPFDVIQPTALFSPTQVRRTGALPDWPTRTMPAVRITETVPDPDEHRARIATALEHLRDPASPLHKVVLARALHLAADAPLDVGTLLRRLAEDASATTYFVDLGAAGGTHVGTALIGASPELLVARRGDVVTCRPFAGSAPRSADPATDRANGAALADSAKDLHEHRLVVDQMRAALQPLCVDLDIAPTPELSRTSAVWHLNTPITGRLRESSTTALDLAIALHPTAAVGGVPTAEAVSLIAQLEGDRGFYAGAVGWCDERGDGTWVVSIRCAELSADRRAAHANSGGGIVAESDPDDEVAETNTKFRTILSALGVNT
ncbi:isochorismate synthase [Mycolicibacterium sp. P1-18]|uniref:isochorismate synthase n=1 Tax=Mycolicibacterium sp. P1-18 TaxID=2024615 RepID=UPI0011F1A2FD|nr:isochorismate synthase [Mycolicibacterium sp. P1-18]KAA0098042.1 isochorismate synthase [Mycolicibacterium sp. P1-18]